MFVAETDQFNVGDALLYRGPSGETVNIARQASGGSEKDYIALSSTCPHLGCQVHWEAHNDRFFCPCHNGVFDRGGKGVSGPPGDAGQSLPRYPLRVDGSLLFIEMPVETLTADGGKTKHASQGEVVARVEGIHAAGHDPCLSGRRLTRSVDGSLG
jgi:nitrite reductase/ring-hydroxylating ferredoxin subunit